MESDRHPTQYTVQTDILTFDMSVGFILQGPDQAQTVLEIAPGETAEIALTGPGKYQYAFASRAEGGETYCIRYKNSFDIDSFIN